MSCGLPAMWILPFNHGAYPRQHQAAALNWFSWVLGFIGTSASATYSMTKWCHLKLGILTNLRMILAYMKKIPLYFYRSTFLGTNITYPLPNRQALLKTMIFRGGYAIIHPKQSPLFFSGQSRAQSWSWSLLADPGGSNFNGKNVFFTVAHHHQGLMIFARCKWWALRYKYTWLFVYFFNDCPVTWTYARQGFFSNRF